MKPEELIESGLLELYAMKATSPEETRLVEEQLRLYPMLKEELNQIEASLELLAKSQSINPSLELDQKIKSNLTFNKEKPDTSKADAQLLKVLHIYRMGLAASLVLLIGLGFIYNETRNQLEEVSLQLAVKNTESSLLSQQVTKTNLNLFGLNQLFMKAQSDSFTKIRLKGTTNYPDANLIVYWNRSSRETIVSINEIPKLADGYDFQLWALVDGKPLNAGVFNAEKDTIIQITFPTYQAEMFAITIEKSGGSAVPNLAQMVAAGTVGS